MKGIYRTTVPLCLGVAVGVGQGAWADDAFSFFGKKTAFGSSVSGFALTRDTEVLTPKGIVKDTDFIPDISPAAGPVSPVSLASVVAPVSLSHPFVSPTIVGPHTLNFQLGHTQPSPVLPPDEGLAHIAPAAGPLPKPMAPSLPTPRFQTEDTSRILIRLYDADASAAIPPGSVPLNPATQSHIFLGPPR